MSSTKEYVATYTLSAQVTEDNYRIMQSHLKCTPETTVAEIMAWVKEQGNGCTQISIALSELDALKEKS